MPTLKQKNTRASLGLVATGAIALATASHATPAFAQEDRQAQSVSERNAPEFTSRPIRLGSFDLFPSISVEADYNDNVFVLPTNEVDDVQFNIRPSILLRKRRPDRDTRLNLNANIRRYVDLINENAEQFSADLRTRQGIGSGTEWRLGAGISQNFEQRRDIEAFNEVGEPINFTNFQGNIGVSQDLGPLKLSLDGRAKAVRFSGTLDLDGETFDLSFRDFETYSGILRASFARSMNQEFYLQVTGESREFELAPFFFNGEVTGVIDRSSQGGRIEAGYRRQVTELLFLDVRAGYLAQDFDQPTLNSVDGLAFSADLLWNATPLTSVKLTGRRQVDDNINPNLNGLVRTEAQLQVEHELMRNMFLMGRIRYADLNQIDDPTDGTQYDLMASAEYRFSRFLGLTVQAERFDRSGLFAFTQNRLRAGVTYNF